MFFAISIWLSAAKMYFKILFAVWRSKTLPEDYKFYSRCTDFIRLRVDVVFWILKIVVASCRVIHSVDQRYVSQRSYGSSLKQYKRSRRVFENPIHVIFFLTCVGVWEGEAILKKCRLIRSVEQVEFHGRLVGLLTQHKYYVFL